MKNPPASKKANLLSILCGAAVYALCCFAVLCVCVLIGLTWFDKNLAFQLTPNISFFPNWVVRFISLFSDMVFESRGTTFITATYLQTEMLCSLIISAFGAAALFLASRPLNSIVFGEQALSKKNARSINLAAISLLLMAIVPAVAESVIIANGNNLHGMYSVNGIVLAVILLFTSLLIKCGVELLPDDKLSVEDEDGKSVSGKTTALSRLAQNSRALSAALWIALVSIFAAMAWVLISVIPLIPHIASDALIERDPGSDPLLAIMLGTVQAKQYSPLALVVRYTWELAALILAALAVIRATKALKRTSNEEKAFSADTAKLFYSCSALVFAVCCVSLAGGIVSFFLSGVRFTVPVCGFLCAAALAACGRLITALLELREQKMKTADEAADDTSDVSFVLN